MKVYHQSTFERWPFEDKSIQAIITSPPYYSLRKYDIPDIIIGGKPECEHEWGATSKKVIALQDKREPEHHSERDKLMDGITVEQGSFCLHCSAWKGQYGLEPTYQLYIEHTLLWAKEAWRVLRDDGVFFLNIGDSWNGGNRGAGMQPEQWSEKQKSNTGTMSWNVPLREKNIPSKCKLLIPHRVAIGLIDNGWILRNDIVWYKPNAMPESCRDRFSKKFEYIFMLTKTGKYAFYLDAVREKANMETQRDKPVNASEAIGNTSSGDRRINYEKNRHKVEFKNPGDIWTINTQPSPEKHYAMWPESLVERMILCSTKAGDAVCDPFAGSACTLRVADRLNRVAYGIDLGYQDIQERRLSNIQKELL